MQTMRGSELDKQIRWANEQVAIRREMLARRQAAAEAEGNLARVLEYKARGEELAYAAGLLSWPHNAR